MYRRFFFFSFFLFFFFCFCGCKWSYFTPPFSCHRTFHVLLKGMLVVSLSVRFPALLPFPTCPLAAVCLAVPFPKTGPPASTYVLPGIPARRCLKGLGLHGPLLAPWSSAFYPHSCPFSLTSQGFLWELWEVPWELDQSSQAPHTQSTSSQGPRSHLSAHPQGLHDWGVLG